MSRPFGVTYFQMFTFYMSIMVGSGFFTLPRDVATIAKQDAWITVAFAGVITMLAGWLATLTAQMYAGETFDRYIRKIIGNLLGTVVLYWLALQILLIIAQEIRRFTFAIKLFMLDQTPFELIVFITIFVAYSFVKSGAETVFNFSTALFLPVIVGIVTVALLTYNAVKLEEITPVLTDVRQVLFALPAAGLAYHGPEVAAGFILPFMLRTEKAITWTLRAVAVVTMVYTVLTITVIGVFSAEELRYIVYPTILVFRATELSVGVLERLDAFFVILYVPLNVMAASGWYYLLASILTRETALQTPRVSALFLAPLIYLFTVGLQDLPLSLAAGEWIGRGAFVYMSVVVPLIWCIARLKQGRSAIGELGK